VKIKNGLIYIDVIKSIENWEPSGKFTCEPEYRDDLIKHLRDELNSNPFFGTKTISVTSEDGRGLSDIAVNEREVGIELKHNFNSKDKLDRLIGQVHRYQKDYNDIIMGIENRYSSFSVLSINNSEYPVIHKNLLLPAPRCFVWVISCLSSDCQLPIFIDCLN